MERRYIYLPTDQEVDERLDQFGLAPDVREKVRQWLWSATFGTQLVNLIMQGYIDVAGYDDEGGPLVIHTEKATRLT